MATMMPASASASSSQQQQQQPQMHVHSHHDTQQRNITTRNDGNHITSPASRPLPPQPVSSQNGQGPSQPSQGSSTSSSVTPSSSANANATATATAPAAPFKPITMKQVMAAHGNDMQQALSGLLGNFNAVLQDRENDKHERTRLHNENTKLWNWSNGFKKERDFGIKELRSLTSRVTELEQILMNNGIAIPLPPLTSSSGSTPSIISSSHLQQSSDMHAYPGNNGDSSSSTAAFPWSTDGSSHRRPSPAPRSISDNGAVGSGSGGGGSGGGSRERQTSGRSDRDRNATVTLPQSQSVNSFHTASSMDSYRERSERDRRPRAGASTPPVGSSSHKSLTPQSHNSPFMGGASPGRSREGTAASSLPPVSSSAAYAQQRQESEQASSSSSTMAMSPSQHQQQQQHGTVGLATIPSTPVLHDSDRLYATGDQYTNSPTAESFSHLSSASAASRSNAPSSDTASVERLRISKQSPLPASPALSSHSNASSFRPYQQNAATSSHQSSNPNSQLPSPMSPRFAPNITNPSSTSPLPEMPTAGSPRHPNFHHNREAQPYHASSSRTRQDSQLSESQQAYVASSSSSVPVSSSSRSDVNNRYPKLSRKASSLDLTTSDSKPIQQRIPSRSATPPPDLGSPKAPGDSPVQYAYAFPPKTPPAPLSAPERGQSLGPGQGFDPRYASQIVTPAGRGMSQATPNRNVLGTPMVDLPVEARHWILANGSNGVPSPAAPLDHRVDRDVAKRMGGLGISDIGLERGLQADDAARHRNASNALQAASHVDGRASPMDDSSATAGILQDAYEPSVLDEPIGTAERTHSNQSQTESDHQEAPRMYNAGTSHPTVPAAQYASQPLPFRTGEQQSAIPLQQPPRPSPAQHRSRDDYGMPQAGAAPNYGSSSSSNGTAAKCVPLVPALLSIVSLDIVASSIKIADRGREVVYFHVRVHVSRSLPPEDPRQALLGGNVPMTWIVEKTWTELQALDQAIRAKNSRSALRKVPSLPDKNLFKDHAPLRVDQRKSAVQKYLQGLCSEESLTERTELCTFLTNGIVSNRTAPVSNPGYKAGYLTKKGRNFGGWTTRYYVLSGRLLEYYDTPGGQHLGSIDIKGANIGRQNSKPSAAGDDAIRHAFLIRAKDKIGEDTDHILCAESDEERDHWVNMLVCCLTGEYIPDTVAQVTSGASVQSAPAAKAPSMTSKSSSQQGSAATAARPLQPPSIDKLRQPVKKGSREVEVLKSTAQPISQLSQDALNAKLFGTQTIGDIQPKGMSQDSGKDGKHRREMSAGQSSTASGTDESSSVHRGLRRHAHGSDLSSSTSMPANLDQLSGPDLQQSSGQVHSMHRFARPVNALNQPDVSSDASASSRPKSPEKRTVKISAPSGGMPIGADFKRSKDERRNKAKSSFWDFAGRRAIERQANATPSRPVFGVPIQEAVEIARVKEDSDLPAVVFRCVQYLSSVKAENEEGIYRMSGSSAVIKNLKERFNAEGDIDLTSEYFDPHAVAGLLKQFFRELPVHIFTAELNHDFIRANDIEDPRKKVKEVTRLVQLLPVANYSALRFLSAHLVNIIKSEHVNKMGVKNMGIVFSPTLAVPATLFSLFINEFDRIFREIDDGDDDEPEEELLPPSAQGMSRERSNSNTSRSRRRSRNSTLFMQSGADMLLEGGSALDDETYESASDSEKGRRRAGDGNEDTLRPYQSSRHNLKIDITSAPALEKQSSGGGEYAAQRSPSINSASSPRSGSYNAPLRSPGLPISPRNTDFLRKPLSNV